MKDGLYRYGGMITSAVHSFGAELSNDEFNTIEERLLDISRAVKTINGNDGMHDLNSTQIIALVVYQYLKELKKI